VTAATSIAEFERYRDHLMGVAYRMLGTVQDAEDAVQETYLRYSGATGTDIRHLRAWLTKTIVRICLDELGSARARRERYVGPWLPEPIVGDGRSMSSVPLGPEDRVTLDESVSIAMLVFAGILGPGRTQCTDPARRPRPAVWRAVRGAWSQPGRLPPTCHQGAHPHT